MQTKKVICDISENQNLVKNLLGNFNRFETFKVVFCKMDYSEFGKTQPQFNRILINDLKPKYQQIYTLIHERIHEIIDKVLGFNIISAKIDGLHDLIDYLVSDFRFTYQSYIFNHGFKDFIHTCISRYVIKRKLTKFKAKFYLIALLKQKGYTEIEIAETLKKVVN